MSRSAKFAWLAVIAALVVSAGCARAVLQVDANGTELLRKPYPLNYPSSAPQPNRVLRELKNERVQITSTTVEKDFLVYQVETADGSVGYVIDGPTVHVEKNR